MKQSKFPPGWDENRVKLVLDHYKAQSEEAIAEDDAADEVQDQTVMGVPADLVPEIRDLISKRKTA